MLTQTMHHTQVGISLGYSVLKIILFTKNDDLLMQSFKLHIVVLQLADVDGEVWRRLCRRYELPWNTRLATCDGRGILSRQLLV